MLPRSARVTALVALAVVSSAALSSCASLELAFGSTTSAAYSTVEGFRADETFPAPAWVPDDATGIRYTTDRGDDSTILSYRSATHFAEGACEALPEPSASASTGGTAAAPAVPVDDSWWPETLPTALFSCGEDWTAFIDGDTVFGFTAGDDGTTSGYPASAARSSDH